MDNIIVKLDKDAMARYIPDEQEIQNICHEYQIGNLIRIDGELGGLFNVNLKITTDMGSYVIRVHSGLSSRHHIDAERLVINELKTNGVPALSPLFTKTNAFYLTLHNRFVQVTPFVRASPFYNLSAQSYACGKTLRKLHDALMNETNIPVPYWSNYPSHQLTEEGLDVLRTKQNHLHDAESIRTVVNLHDRIMEYWSGFTTWLISCGLFVTPIIMWSWGAVFLRDTAS